MATLSRSSGHKHENHDWESLAYVSHWAEGQDKKEAVRQEPFRVLAQTISYDKGLPIKILDVGAGYGALTQFLLGYFPNATAICQDGSQEMMKMGHQRMASYEGRFKYVQSDFGKSGWSQGLARPFEAVVSSIAIHNVRDPKVMEDIYQEILPLLKNGGCFLNFDRPRPPFEEQLSWLRQAGYVDVKCFWKDETRGVFGGFKRE
jgi:ubiquinone/menaquinone biosynthesis C-methylase UbiE